jgi:hypothetical protein
MRVIKYRVRCCGLVRKLPPPRMSGGSPHFRQDDPIAALVHSAGHVLHWCYAARSFSNSGFAA